MENVVIIDIINLNKMIKNNKARELKIQSKENVSEATSRLIPNIKDKRHLTLG